MQDIKNFILRHYIITTCFILIMSTILAIFDWPSLMQIGYHYFFSDAQNSTIENEKKQIFNSEYWNALVAIFSYYALFIALYKEKLVKLMFCPILQYNVKMIYNETNESTDREYEEDSSNLASSSSEVLSYYFEVSNSSQYAANNCRLSIKKLFIMKDDDLDNWQEIPNLLSFSCPWSIENDKIICIPRGHSGYLKIFEIKNSKNAILDSKQQQNKNELGQDSNKNKQYKDRKIEHAFPLLNNSNYKINDYNVILKLCINADNLRPDNIYIKIFIKTFSNKILKDNKIDQSYITVKIIKEKDFQNFTKSSSKR